ncbi:hypothetical protein [Heyndrickxia camelliae]|uniref:Uncharacterized protein n=1 Tax=Heyndrickxia camelliae TaxID=1707093 RepID=A0A2N3LNG8_9BACI|nr:hypothetical protein [Heyndrickxia camelliae]PKR86074.1 hypothetical protein CWO92_06800 [Heyndrickxia camelliae]
MNKLQVNFMATLAMLGLENKAQDVLVNDFKSQLETFKDTHKTIENAQAVHEQYNNLSKNLTTEKKALEAEVVELKESINNLDVKGDIVAQVMTINKSIQEKEERIAGIASTQLLLGGKARQDIIDALYEGYKAHKALSSEIYQLIGTVKPIINQANKAQIVKALQSVVNELNHLGYILRDITASVNAERLNYKGVVFSISNTSIISAMSQIERM